MKFKPVLAMVLQFLGVPQLKDNKLTEDEEKKLIDAYGPEFANKFKSELEKGVTAEESEEDAVYLQSIRNAAAKEIRNELQPKLEELAEVKRQLAEKETVIASQRQVISQLSDAAEDSPKGKSAVIVDNDTDDDDESSKGKGLVLGVGKSYSINQKLYHNKVAAAELGYQPAPYLTDPSISVTDLKTEFGNYYVGSQRDIIRGLYAKTETMNYMTTKMTDESVWRASHEVITSVVQQFSSKWTPLGSTSFTPIEITMRRHKINVPITPADIIDSWIAFLYDEQLEPKDMPITKYIIEKMIMPQAESDRELKLIGKGEFTALGTVSTNDAGQATGKGMDGFMTILRKLYEDTDNKVNWVKLGVITASNVIDKMNTFADAIPELLGSTPMNTFMSVQMRKLYKRTYQATYPNTKEVDKNDEMIDFSNLTIKALPSMSMLNSFFATTKENFIRLRGKNDGASRMWMQAQDYDVKVFAEWKEAVGFAVQEAITAYIDPLWVLNGYAVKNDASKLQIYMLTDAGATSVDATKLAAYKTAIAAADSITTLTALQTIITTVNAA